MNKTEVYQMHLEKKAQMFDFAGWSMPLFYQSIVAEHGVVRQDCGIFDVSHMGKFVFSGPDALNAVDYLISNNLKKLGKGRCVYSPMLYDNGSFVDDVIAYCQSDDLVWMIVNAANTMKDEEWCRLCLKESPNKFDVQIKNVSREKSLFAIQGRNAEKIVKNLFPSLTINETFSFEWLDNNEGEKDVFFVAYTGYTGEYGVEVMMDSKYACSFFQKVLDLGVQPCGLGARDVLRLEKGYSLYGHEIDDQTNPFEAGLRWSVDLTKDFVGKNALLEIEKNPLKKKLVGFILNVPMIARHDFLVYSAESDHIKAEDTLPIGKVTSGAFSPTLKKSIGLAFIPKDYKEKEILIEIRGKKQKATLHKRSFC